MYNKFLISTEIEKVYRIQFILAIPLIFHHTLFIYYYILIYNKIPISILYSCENKTVYCILYTIASVLEHIASCIGHSSSDGK